MALAVAQLPPIRAREVASYGLRILAPGQGCQDLAAAAAVDERDAAGGGSGSGGVGLGGVPVRPPCASFQDAVRPKVVVVGAEGVERVLQVGEGGRAGLAGQPLLQRLTKAFDLAADLRVVGPTVAEQHAAGVQCDLESDAAPRR